MGIDEAGRGPLAGPVVSAAVILDSQSIPKGINDSKKISPKNRINLYNQIIASSTFAIGVASTEEIDKLNILNATMLSMKRAYNNIVMISHNKPTFVIIDGNKGPNISCKTKTIVRGDAISLSIAAASIIAKVSRDKMMFKEAEKYPNYNFEKNLGYGTKTHLLALTLFGKCIIHRNSFRPIRPIRPSIQ